MYVSYFKMIWVGPILLYINNIKVNLHLTHTHTRRYTHTGFNSQDKYSYSAWWQ